MCRFAQDDLEEGVKSPKREEERISKENLVEQNESLRSHWKQAEVRLARYPCKGQCLIGWVSICGMP